MNHPGLHDLLDGRLDPAQAEIVLGHVAACPGCAAVLGDLRRARAALAARIPVPADLTARLLALAEAPAPAPPGPPPVVTGLDGLAPRRRWRPIVPVAAAAIVAALVVIGEPRTVTPDPHPAAALAVLAGRPAGAAATAPGIAMPAGDAPASVELLGTALPEDITVLDVAGDPVSGVLEVTVSVPGGARVVIERAEGRLADAVLATHPTTDLGGRTVVVLSREPFHAVWQCDDAVLGVVGPDRGAVADLVAALPGEAYDAGALTRVVRGWQVVAGAWVP